MNEHEDMELALVYATTIVSSLRIWIFDAMPEYTR